MLMRSSESSFFPTRNILLAQLNDHDRRLLAPHLRRVSIERGAAVLTANTLLDAIYFPESVLVSIEEETVGHEHIEVGLVGREGLLGWPVLLGSMRSMHEATIQMRGGTMLHISASDFSAACLCSQTLLAMLLRFVEIITVQMTRAIVSNLCDPVERRISRWLLMRHDRVAGDELLIRHDEISTNLGIRRASVTDGLHILEGERLIRCFRGRILVRDRSKLEDYAGEAYGTAETHYRSLIAPFGRSTRPLAQA